MKESLITFLIIQMLEMTLIKDLIIDIKMNKFITLNTSMIWTKDPEKISNLLKESPTFIMNLIINPCTKRLMKIKPMIVDMKSQDMKKKDQQVQFKIVHQLMLEQLKPLFKLTPIINTLKKFQYQERRSKKI